MRIWTTLAVLAAMFAGSVVSIVPAKATTCYTNCYSRGTSCTTTCY
jgi:hypothetical protein